MPQTLEEPSHQLEIKASIADRISFATYQNHVPVIADLELINNSERHYEKLKVILECKPALIGPKTWRIDRLSPHGSMPLTECDVPIEGGLLSDLNERMRANLKITVRQGTNVLSSLNHNLIGLAKNEWGGMHSMPEILAAFVMANDPCVSRLLKTASDTLLRASEPHAIDGYQSKSRQRVWQLVSAIWSAISSLQLSYAEPPASFEREGQKIRTPQQITDEKLATCLDLAVLFAASLELAGLNPLIVFTEGHAFCGVWLQPQQLPALTTDDPTDLRKFIDLQELIIFETTLVTKRHPVNLSQAIESAKQEISPENQHQFLYALDIKRARSQQVTPLNSDPSLIKREKLDSEELQLQTLEAAPELPGFDFGIDEGPPPDSPETRLDHWKRKLLDLTKRNRLLNLKLTKTAIRLLCSDPATLEDKLASGKKVTIVPTLKQGQGDGARDSKLYQQRTGKEFLKEYATQVFARDEIVADLPDTLLNSSLIQLYRKANTDIQEGGANTLFLALGLLKWKQTPYEKRSYLAPLILLPVKLLRKSAISKIKLVIHEDAPVFNMTLLELLRQDFHLEIPELNGDLPQDNSGIDVPLIWNTVRKAVRDLAGFEVLEDIVLSTFSFAKFLMWKDLADRTEVLKESPFVKHLIDNPREPYPNSASFLQANDIDKKLDPADLLMPLPADSSQIVAVHASAQGGDFILEGPPGTGKSQTIANIIAHNLGLGRRVLFVSEKMAALDVVHRRLRDIGLGDFCLELHSHKANKREVLDQLGNSLKNRTTRSPSQWSQEAEKLKQLRDQLNEFVQTLHKPGPTGVSPRAAMGRVAMWGQIHKLRLDWGSSLEADYAKNKAELEHLIRVVENLGQCFSEIDKNSQASFSEIDPKEWSRAWEKQLISCAKELDLASQTLGHSSKEFLQLLNLSQTTTKPQHLKGLAKIASCLPTAASHSLGFALETGDTRVLTALNKALTLLDDYRNKKANFGSVIDDEAVGHAPFEQWQYQWTKASAAWWLPRVLGKKRISKEIQAHFKLANKANPEQFLPFLQQLRALCARMDEETKALPHHSPWQGLQTNIQTAQTCTQAAQTLCEGIAEYAENLNQHSHIREAVRRMLVDGHQLIQPGTPISLAAKRLQEEYALFEKAYSRYCQESHAPQNASEDLETLASKTQNVVALQPRLNAWCRWKAVCREARASGLEQFIKAIEEGQLTKQDAGEAFITAYHAWLADCFIDKEDVLRTFSAANHTNIIQRFREVDKNLAKLSVDYISAKLKGNIPNLEGKKLPQGYGVLAHELQKRMRHIPVRKLISQMGNALTELTPCILMSPLSISQYLAADNQLFDLVVFDEASQITVWDAIGAIARGKNVIVVGDPKQMPPSNFFGRSSSEDSDESNGNIADDLESILDEALAAKIKRHRLSGHYRSRHESLIAFSNHRYYRGDLITFPSAETRDTAVSFKNVGGLYQRGKGRTNPDEAQAVVAAVIARLKDPATNHQSIGIVTFNSDQQRVIDDLLDQARRNDPELEPFFSQDLEEPVFVKNLETVQGDQRDIIFLSVAYGPDTAGAKTMSMNFGPLNRKGGERRLNVAITRATTEMVIFCSFDPSMIDLTRTSAVAIRDLKHYLEFAQRGPEALGEAILSIGGTDQYDSEFEEAVAQELRRLGWMVHTQIGVSKFRIDLGIVHPDLPGKYLAGIECDGATYHRSPSARDRDRVRHEILEHLSWRLIRIWSTDFFIDSNTTMARVHEKLQRLLSADREASEENKETEHKEIPTHKQFKQTSPKASDSNQAPNSLIQKPIDQPAQHSSNQSNVIEIRKACLEMVNRLGPVTFNHLCEMIADRYQQDKTDVDLRTKVKQALGKTHKWTRVAKHPVVIWPPNMAPAKIVSFRGFTVGEERRKWQHIPYPEKMGFVASTLKKDPTATPLLAIGSRLKLKQPMSQKVREQLQSLLDDFQDLK